MDNLILIAFLFIGYVLGRMSLRKPIPSINVEEVKHTLKEQAKRFKKPSGRVISPVKQAQQRAQEEELDNI